MSTRLDYRRGLELHATTIDRLHTCLKGALAAACAQRQGEVYRAYARRTNDGSAKGFDNLLNAIWDDIRYARVSEQEHRKWNDQAEKLYPIKKGTTDRCRAGAELAVLSLLYSNDVLGSGKTQYTIDAAHQTFGSIEHFLTSSIGQKPQFKMYHPEANAKVLAHPLTEAEHCRQERDLFDLEQALLRPDTMADFVNRLRKRAEIEAKIFLPIFDGSMA